MGDIQVEVRGLKQQVSALAEKLVTTQKTLASTLKKLTKAENLCKRTQSYNAELEEQLDKLNREIQEYRSGRQRTTNDMCVQVQSCHCEDFLTWKTNVWRVNVKQEPVVLPSNECNGTCDEQVKQELSEESVDQCESCSPAEGRNTGETNPPSVKLEITQVVGDEDHDEIPQTLVDETKAVEPMSIEESLRAAAEEVVQQSGYVYDERSGMYYDYNTGYYYDNEKALYYDPASGTYFYYDHSSKEYKFHSQVDWQQYSSTFYPQKHTKGVDAQEDVSDVVNAFSRMNIEQARKTALDNSKLYPPCIRAMVMSSNCLSPGSLYLITCTGATIGREKDLNHTIHIPDPLVSKMHAEIRYNEEKKKYELTDFASQNGTFINGHRVCEPKVKSVPKLLFHRCELSIGGTVLELHIHSGTETCDGCEPGLVMAKMQQEKKVSSDNSEMKVLSKGEREQLRRKRLKQIKKKFGLESSGYVNSLTAVKPGYEDKAEERRKTVGSDNPYQKDEAPASVERAISTQNKGHKLLEKMGWTEGQTLGKSQTGIAEPIKVSIRSAPKAGLGHGYNLDTSFDNVHDLQKREQWSKMQQRFAGELNTQAEEQAELPAGTWLSGGVEDPKTYTGVSDSDPVQQDAG